MSDSLAVSSGNFLLRVTRSHSGETKVGTITVRVLGVRVYRSSRPLPHPQDVADFFFRKA